MDAAVAADVPVVQGVLNLLQQPCWKEQQTLALPLLLYQAWAAADVHAAGESYPQQKTVQLVQLYHPVPAVADPLLLVPQLQPS
jgi:hypothetical protein